LKDAIENSASADTIKTLFKTLKGDYERLCLLANP